MDELELVHDFVQHLKHTGEPPLPEVPGSDGLTTAFLFQGELTLVFMSKIK